MRRVALALLTLLGGCTSSQMVKVEIVNATPYPLVLTAKTWIFAPTIVIPAGEIWRGSLDRRVVGPTATITVRWPSGK
jgi:hypothetical protein